MGLSKDDYVLELLTSCDIFIVSEVWLTSVALPLVMLEEWNMLSTLYPASSRGTTFGGLLVYSRKTLPYSVELLSVIPISWKPIVWLKVGDTIIGAAYLPPENSSFLTHWDENPVLVLCQQLARFAIRFPHSPFLLLGDFNARAAIGPDPTTSHRGRLLLAALPDTWAILNTEFTHVTGDLNSYSTLDYVIANEPARERNLEFSTGPLNLGLSDHAWIRVDTTTLITPKPVLAPLPHHRPPLPMGKNLADELEEDILELLPTHPPIRHPPEQLILDTTEINRLRKAAEHFHNSYCDNPSPLRRALAKRTYGLLAKARRRFRHLRRDHLARYLSSLPKAEWWSYANRLWKKKDSGAIHVSGPDLYAHFNSLLHTGCEVIPPFVGPSEASSPFERDFTDEEVSTVLAKLKNSASGEDKITTDQVRAIPISSMTYYLNKLLELGEVPASWTRMILITLPKPGSDSSIPANLRGICLQNKFRKIFTTLLTNRLFEFIAHKIPPTQCGFQPGRRTTENLFLLRTLHEQAVERQEDLYAAQIDLRRAFDTVSRPLLFDRLYALGVNGRLISLLRLAYQRQEVFVKANKRFSDVIRADTGLPQGDPLSPLMFIIYMLPFDLKHADDP